jgi:predicted dehydrogenase
MNRRTDEKAGEFSRRDFIKTSAAVSLAALGPGASRIFAAGAEKIRYGVIGFGGRAAGAASNAVFADPAVEIVAVGDLFDDHIDESMDKLINGSQWVTKIPKEKVKVTKETRFTGFDSYKGVLACGVDVVILASPPHFRPMHLKACVEAGKHVFMEKPVAVDPVGVRSIIVSSDLAKEKGLAIVSGTMKRHDPRYIEIMKRIHRGDIGELVAGQCYYNTGSLWIKPRQPQWSDMEWQIRNWLYFTWLSGDHIVEQHIHNIDAVNWAFGTHPVKCLGIGGREVRTDPKWGNIYDHFTVEFEYANGARILSMCRQMDGCSDRMSERVVGTKGVADMDRHEITGANPYKYEGEPVDPYIQEHKDLIAGVRDGKPLNEGRQVAESSLTAIMGRMSAYTGRELSWDWAMNASKLDLSPAKYEFSELPVEPVAVPGKTPLV